MNRRVFLIIAVALCLADPTWAGPNANGTLVVHDASLTYTAGSASPPSEPPTSDPPTVDNQLPVGIPSDDDGWIWKVYAAFPVGASPRLKGLAMGEQFTSGVVVLGGGPPSSDTFEIPQNGWPTTSGGGVGMSFATTQTSLMVECYWFGGYGDQGSTWAVAPHPVQQMIFVDDAFPAHTDLIAGLSSIGFGVDGYTVYPEPLEPTGACCRADGTCSVTYEAECPTGNWNLGIVCDPNPCPQPPLGACCYPDGACASVVQASCATGDWRMDIPCDPNPCPQPPMGACCSPDGTCQSVIQSQCSTGDWRMDIPCDPNPCPQPPMGACCSPDGTCQSVIQSQCSTGDWRLDVPCDPNPCPQPLLGACCSPDGTCRSIIQSQCSTGDWRLDVPCDPSPCPILPLGACCRPDGHCLYTYRLYCTSGDWRLGILCDPNPCPQPPLGACCHPDGTCQVVIQAGCTTGDWRLGVPCDPNPCPVLQMGACCTGMDCQITTEMGCGGLWIGAGTNCSPNPCCGKAQVRRASGPPPGGLASSPGRGPGNLQAATASKDGTPTAPRAATPGPGSRLPREDVAYNTGGEIDYVPQMGGSATGWAEWTITFWRNDTGMSLLLSELSWPCSGPASGAYGWLVWLDQTDLPGPAETAQYYGPYTPVDPNPASFPPTTYTYIDVSAASIIVHAGTTLCFGFDNTGMQGMTDYNCVETWGWYGGIWDSDSAYGRTAIMQLKASFCGSTPVEPTSWGKIKARFH
jgi:uncharacterized protein YodC (DUF2158 family)